MKQDTLTTDDDKSRLIDNIAATRIYIHDINFGIKIILWTLIAVVILTGANLVLIIDILFGLSF